jgi:RNA polymerase sigma-70 factor (ECF subfamily)
MNVNHRTGPDDDRLERWVREHGRAVRGYLQALVRREAEVEELVQDVFRRAWQARQSYRENGTARAYLIRIADRLACDWARKNRPEVNLDATAWKAIEPSTTTEEPASRLRRAEIHRELADAINRLTPDQQRVLLLRYYTPMTFTEIADVMHCPLNTVLSHCRRGLLALRQTLAEHRP